LKLTIDFTIEVIVGAKAVDIEQTPLVNWAAFADARSMLGTDFVRILGYFREDGVKSVAALEDSARSGNAAGMVIPAHTLKGESSQFGAERLALATEKIEMMARRCVEQHQNPDELINDIVGLRALFEVSLALLEKESNPLVQRTGFGRKSAMANTAFGRG